MRIISNEELSVVAGGAEVCTTTPLKDGGSTTTCALNGTSTITTSFPNGNSTIVVTNKDGHGSITTNTVVTKGSGSAEISVDGKVAGGKGGGSVNGGTTTVSRTVQFLVEPEERPLFGDAW